MLTPNAPNTASGTLNAVSAPVTHDERIDALHLALMTETLRAPHTPAGRRAGPVGETLRVSVDSQLRQRVIALAHEHGVHMDTDKRYQARAYGETRTLTICTSPISVSSISTSYAHALLGINYALVEQTGIDLHHTLRGNSQGPTRFRDLLNHVAWHHLDTGSYGTDPDSGTPLAGTLSVLLRDTRLFSDAWCYGHDTTDNCRIGHTVDVEALLLEHLGKVDLIRVAERLSTDT